MITDLSVNSHSDAENDDNEHNNQNEIGAQLRVASQAEQAEALAAAAAEMMEQRGLPSLHSLTPADENLRVITVSNLFEPSEAPNPNRDGGEAYTAWEESMVDDIWAECCRHGEVNIVAIRRARSA